MCGINGFNFRNKILIQKMNQVIKHRGPDDEGVYLNDNISLGNVRLNIIDLSLAGHMPMTNNDQSLSITYNGEIYNFQKLRESLKKFGYKFKSNTDTEVILYLYEKYGEKCLQKLNGMFSFGIWDRNKKQLFLARDRVGIKPLYYFWDGRRFIFSSEIKALLLHKLSKQIDRISFQLYMRLGYVPGERTVFKNIHRLLPGHFLVFKKGKIKIKRYWEIRDCHVSPAKMRGIAMTKKNEVKKTIKNLLTDSIKRRLVADRPVGVFLSGGIDSTTILALASRIKREPIQTFSVGFDINIEEEKYNADFYLARKSAEIFGAKHNELLLSSKEALAVFEKVIWHLDEPIANPNTIPIFLISRMAKQKVAVVLGGDGGDELFGGYDRYWQAHLLSCYQKLPKILREKLFNSFLQRLARKEPGFANRLNLTRPLEKYFLFMGDSEDEIGKLSVRKIPLNKLYEHFDQHLAKHEFCNFLDNFSYLDFKNWLPEESLIKSDKMTMASGLEQRVPFLDHRIVELAFKIPWQYKLGMRLRKKILRETFSNLLPKEILTAQKKGFFPPAAKWLRDKKWQEFVRSVLSKSEIKKHGFWNFEEVNKMVINHINKKKYNLSLIWMLLTFQLWYKEYVNE